MRESDPCGSLSLGCQGQPLLAHRLRTQSTEPIGLGIGNQDCVVGHRERLAAPFSWMSGTTAAGAPIAYQDSKLPLPAIRPPLIGGEPFVRRETSGPSSCMSCNDGSPHGTESHARPRKNAFPSSRPIGIWQPLLVHRLRTQSTESIGLGVTNHCMRPVLTTHENGNRRWRVGCDPNRPGRLGCTSRIGDSIGSSRPAGIA